MSISSENSNQESILGYRSDSVSEIRLTDGFTMSKIVLKMKNRHKVAQNRTRMPVTSVFKLEEGFCDPVTHHRSIAAVMRLADGTRIELAVRDAVDGFICEGPRVERHQLLVSTPCRHSASVIVVQLDDLRKLSGVPEVLTALELFEAGDLTSAVRYVAAAGPRWAPLIDLLGGPR